MKHWLVSQYIKIHVIRKMVNILYMQNKNLLHFMKLLLIIHWFTVWTFSFFKIIFLMCVISIKSRHLSRHLFYLNLTFNKDILVDSDLIYYKNAREITAQISAESFMFQEYINCQISKGVWLYFWIEGGMCKCQMSSKILISNYWIIY